MIFYFSHQSRGRLSDLVAEHLDHIHYVNDILCLSIDNLNEVLVEQLFQRLLLPLYINSLNKGNTSKTISFAIKKIYIYISQDKFKQKVETVQWLAESFPSFF